MPKPILPHCDDCTEAEEIEEAKKYIYVPVV
jgi:hypothetical protein